MFAGSHPLPADVGMKARAIFLASYVAGRLPLPPNWHWEFAGQVISTPGIDWTKTVITVSYTDGVTELALGNFTGFTGSKAGTSIPGFSGWDEALEELRLHTSNEKWYTANFSSAVLYYPWTSVGAPPGVTVDVSQGGEGQPVGVPPGPIPDPTEPVGGPPSTEPGSDKYEGLTGKVALPDGGDGGGGGVYMPPVVEPPAQTPPGSIIIKVPGVGDVTVPLVPKPPVYTPPPGVVVQIPPGEIDVVPTPPSGLPIFEIPKEPIRPLQGTPLVPAATQPSTQANVSWIPILVVIAIIVFAWRVL